MLSFPKLVQYATIIVFFFEIFFFCFEKNSIDLLVKLTESTV